MNKSEENVLVQFYCFNVQRFISIQPGISMKNLGTILKRNFLITRKIKGLYLMNKESQSYHPLTSTVGLTDASQVHLVVDEDDVGLLSCSKFLASGIKATSRIEILEQDLKTVRYRFACNVRLVTNLNIKLVLQRVK